MSGKARNSTGQAGGTSCCLQTVTGMEDLCALVLGLKPRGCASAPSVAELDVENTHPCTQTCRVVNFCASICTKHIQYFLCVFIFNAHTHSFLSF